MGRRTVAVIGAGVLGMAAAQCLSERGARVVVVERATICAGVTGLSVGVVETQYLEEDEIALRARSREVFDRWRRDHGLVLHETGFLRLARSEATAAAFELSRERQRVHGLSGVEVVGVEALSTLVPDLATAGVVAGLWGRRDGYLDPHGLCHLLAELVRGAGGRILQHAEVLGLGHGPGGRHRLETSRGPVDADVVVNAAGAQAGQVAERLGQSLRLVVEDHEVFRVALPRSRSDLPSVVDYVPGSDVPGFWLRPDGPGTILSGLHVERGAEPGDHAGTGLPSTAESWMRRLVELFPAWEDAGLVGGWTGPYPGTESGRPVVGPLSADASVLTLAGAGAYGVQVAPALGEEIARQAMR